MNTTDRSKLLPAGTPVAFQPDLAFGQLRLLNAGRTEVVGEVPSWLVDRPDVIAALAILAGIDGNDGTAIRRSRDDKDVVVHLDNCTVEHLDMVDA